MARHYDSGEKSEVALELVAIAGRETDHADAGSDVDLWDRMDIILRVERDVVLLEVAGTNRRTDIDGFCCAVSAGRGIEEEVPSVVRLVDQIGTEIESVVRQHFLEADLVANRIAVRIVPFLLLRAESEDVGGAVVEAADVHEPGGVGKGGGAVEEEIFTGVDETHFVGVVLVVLVVHRCAVEAAGSLIVIVSGTIRLR